MMNKLNYIFILNVIKKKISNNRVRRMIVLHTSTGHPSTTNTSKEYPSVVEKTWASRMFSPMSESNAESWKSIFSC